MYLKYIVPEDLHIYSIDEVFIDVISYLNTYQLSAHELAMKMIRDVLNTTGITATAGVGTNLFLAKVAMDIVAKHIPADKDGVRMAELDEMEFRRQLWNRTIVLSLIFGESARAMQESWKNTGCSQWGDVARCSVDNVDLLYRLFGVNAELLIDHAWGWEPWTIKEIKVYKPSSNSVGSGQVLHCSYNFEKAKLVVRKWLISLSWTWLTRGW